MRLRGEIFKQAIGGAFQSCTLLPLGGGYFEGVKAVGDFSPERIVFYFPQTGVEILGEKLSIGRYCEGDLQILGKITCLRVLNGEDAPSVGR